MTLEDLISEGTEISSDVCNYPLDPADYIADIRRFADWSSMSLMYLQENYPSHPQTKRFNEYVEHGKTLQTHCIAMLSILKSFKEYSPADHKIEYNEVLNIIFENFNTCAKQLCRRHFNRQTLKIKDEYDVQDLLNALLRLHFEDVRPEEWTPSYAGGNNRMDFLLKDEEIAIEVKMTRNGLKDKEVGEQLLIDIAKYQAHPNCKCLYCFVYDPNEYIRNPRGLEKDLSATTGNIDVKVYIRPL